MTIQSPLDWKLSHDHSRQTILPSLFHYLPVDDDGGGEMKDVRVHIGPMPWSDRVAVTFFKDTPQGSFIAKPVEFEWVQFSEFSVIQDPTFQWRSIEAQQIMKALAEAMDGFNIKTDQDAKLQGTIEAMKRHLEDMRALVFKDGGKP